MNSEETLQKIIALLEAGCCIELNDKDGTAFNELFSVYKEFESGRRKILVDRCGNMKARNA